MVDVIFGVILYNIYGLSRITFSVAICGTAVSSLTFNKEDYDLSRLWQKK